MPEGPLVVEGTPATAGTTKNDFKHLQPLPPIASDFHDGHASISEYEETADTHNHGGQLLVSLRDPTQQPNTVFEDLEKKVQRDRAVFYQGKQNEKGTHGSRGPLIGASKMFSGAIFKRTIELKDKEINHLRKELYNHTLGEKLEHENVEKLRVALNRSMKYYSYAEEWQMKESSRLQQDVRYLKAEMSSLMAFLINSEEDKRK
ncbi:hypothetical protein HDU76_013937, partial [Blyttiomyces sp. JEL0837]